MKNHFRIAVAFATGWLLFAGMLSAQQGNNGNTVPVCHNGNTIYVNQSAVAAHLAHGDTEGACADDCINPNQICPTCFCILLYNPVCGCDGNTYSNSCFAAISGVTSVTPGACGATAAADDPASRRIGFRNPADQVVHMEILDLNGHRIAVPFSGMAAAGEYYFQPELPSGNYVCRIATASESHTERFEVQ